MKKLTFVVAVLTLAIAGTAGAASATGGGSGRYAAGFPTVAPSTSVVQPGASFTVTAKNFCPGQPVTITLVNFQHTYSQGATASTTPPPGGQAVVTFTQPPVAAGVYLIVASSGSPCNRIALSYVQVLAASNCSTVRTNSSNDSCSTHHLTAFNLGSGGAAGDVDSLVAALTAANVPAEMQAQVLSDSVAAAPAGAVPGSRAVGSDSLPATGSSISNVQLALAIVLGGVGLIVVGRRRVAVRSAPRAS